MATTLPKELPITMVGIKIPPYPPAAKVAVIAIALKTVMPASNPIMIQILDSISLNGVVPIALR